MQTLTRFWRSLERLAGAATVAAEWRAWLGPEYDATRPLLRASGELAAFYPRPGRLPYRVVSHGAEDHVGVCDETGQRVTLTTAELAILEVDRPKLDRALAAAIGSSGRAIRDPRYHTVQLGCDNRPGGFQFPVFLILHHRALQVRHAVQYLAVTQQGPFLALTTSSWFLDTETAELLQRRDGWLCPLDEATGIDDGKLALTDRGRQLLAAFHDKVLPTGETDSRFPTPPGSRWSQLSIRLVDGETVAVAVGDVRGTFNYTQMGLADRRSGRPNKQWELLRALAARHGLLTWSSPAASRHNQKRRELLAHQLRRYFRIDGDPFERCGNGWRTRFAISDEP
jgi:hypothetical protein